MSARSFLNLAFGIAVSAALLYRMWLWHGAFGLVFGMPVLAILAIPLLQMFGLVPFLGKWFAFRKVAGRYYEFRGRHVDIDIDAEATCWVSTAHVRRILPSLPADAVLERLHPDAVGETGDPRTWRITSAALLAVLRKATDPDTARFCLWLDKQVAEPARKRFQRRMPIR